GERRRGALGVRHHPRIHRSQRGHWKRRFCLRQRRRRRRQRHAVRPVRVLRLLRYPGPRALGLRSRLRTGQGRVHAGEGPFPAGGRTVPLPCFVALGSFLDVDRTALRWWEKFGIAEEPWTWNPEILPKNG